jgi:hypothetical protein
MDRISLSQGSEQWRILVSVVIFCRLTYKSGEFIVLTICENCQDYDGRRCQMTGITCGKNDMVFFAIAFLPPEGPTEPRTQFTPAGDRYAGLQLPVR